MKLKLSLSIALAVLAAACQTTAPPPTIPQDQQQILDIDPRLGSSQPVEESLNRRYQAAVREIQSGRPDQASERLAALQQRNPAYRPILVAQANLAIRRGNLVAAQSLVDRVLAEEPDYLAAKALAAELALRRDDLALAYSILQPLSGATDAPAGVTNAFATTRQRYFDSLFVRANASSDPEEAISLLRQALAVSPAAEAARVALVQRLIGASRFDDARRQLEPLVQSQPGSEIVEWALAEIDAGKGRYQEAIARYEKLARTDSARYGARLNEVKEKWLEANMPPQYLDAMSSDAITRADLAVLMYWKVKAVRFAQNVPPPPIAIDVDAAGVDGRDEFVRALALRLYAVDPVTRLSSPARLITADGFVRLAERLLTMRGAPACARGVSADGELARAVKVLAACGVDVRAMASSAEQPVSGRVAAGVLDAIDAAASAE